MRYKKKVRDSIYTVLSIKKYVVQKCSMWLQNHQHNGVLRPLETSFTEGKHKTH